MTTAKNDLRATVTRKIERADRFALGSAQQVYQMIEEASGIYVSTVCMGATALSAVLLLAVERLFPFLLMAGAVGVCVYLMLPFRRLQARGRAAEFDALTAKWVSSPIRLPAVGLALAVLAYSVAMQSPRMILGAMLAVVVPYVPTVRFRKGARRAPVKPAP